MPDCDPDETQSALGWAICSDGEQHQLDRGRMKPPPRSGAAGHRLTVQRRKGERRRAPARRTLRSRSRRRNRLRRRWRAPRACRAAPMPTRRAPDCAASSTRSGTGIRIRAATSPHWNMISSPGSNAVQTSLSVSGCVAITATRSSGVVYFARVDRRVFVDEVRGRERPAPHEVVQPRRAMREQRLTVRHQEVEHAVIGDAARQLADALEQFGQRRLRAGNASRSPCISTQNACSLSVVPTGW